MTTTERTLCASTPDELRAVLVQYDDASRKLGHVPADWAYASHHGYVADHGEGFTGAALHPSIEPGEPQSCYDNAYRLAMRRPELTYVEGFGSSLIAIAHAWCVDADGNVVDNTWPDPETRSYFGVRIPLDVLCVYALRHERAGVFANDYVDGAPIMRLGVL